jgi:hypothetical protein
MTTSVTEKTRRVQMELSLGSFERLNRLKELSEATSYTEVMKDALRLYEYFIEQDINGSTFIVESKDGKKSEVKIFA